MRKTFGSLLGWVALGASVLTLATAKPAAADPSYYVYEDGSIDYNAYYNLTMQHKYEPYNMYQGYAAYTDLLTSNGSWEPNWMQKRIVVRLRPDDMPNRTNTSDPSLRFAPLQVVRADDDHGLAEIDVTTCTTLTFWPDQGGHYYPYTTNNDFLPPTDLTGGEILNVTFTDPGDYHFEDGFRGQNEFHERWAGLLVHVSGPSMTPEHCYKKERVIQHLQEKEVRIQQVTPPVQTFEVHHPPPPPPPPTQPPPKKKKVRNREVK